MNQEIFIDPDIENMIKEDRGIIAHKDRLLNTTYIYAHYKALNVSKLKNLTKFGKILSILSHVDTNIGRLVYCVKVELR